ncbi:hypothetical protein CIW54_08685 [Paraburkholderia sp. T12-10]|nr:hypothetical protein CIW54_08685 [Paraburkholderia sp. T12-10]
MAARACASSPYGCRTRASDESDEDCGRKQTHRNKQDRLSHASLGIPAPHRNGAIVINAFYETVSAARFEGRLWTQSTSE